MTSVSDRETGASAVSIQTLIWAPLDRSQTRDRKRPTRIHTHIHTKTNKQKNHMNTDMGTFSVRQVRKMTLGKALGSNSLGNTLSNLDVL